MKKENFSSILLHIYKIYKRYINFIPIKTLEGFLLYLFKAQRHTKGLRQSLGAPAVAVF